MSATLNPYLNFDGDCKAAMEFYHQALGGSLSMQTYGETPDHTDEATKNLIVHAVLDTNGMKLMAADDFNDNEIIFGTNVHLSISGDDETSLTEVFNNLADGGSIDMPLAKQFWGDTFGMLTDKFQIKWMVNINAAPATPTS